MSTSIVRQSAATSSMPKRVVCLVLALVLAIGLCPAVGFAATEKGSVKVNFRDTAGNSLGYVSKTGTVGTSYTSVGSDGKSLVDDVNERIAELKKDGYTLSSNGFKQGGAYAANAGKPVEYSIVFKAPAAKPVTKVKVRFLDHNKAEIASVSGSATSGTAFSATGDGGLSLNDRYNSMLQQCKDSGYVLSRSDYKTSGAYADVDQTINVYMTRRSSTVNVSIVDTHGNQLASASGQSTEGKRFTELPTTGKSLWDIVNTHVNNYKAKGYTVTNWGGFTSSGTYKAGTQNYKITLAPSAKSTNFTGWKDAGGKSYYYIRGVKQGTQGRGCEIFDGKAWYWLDAVQGGAKTVNKDVFIPYFYSNDSMNASNQRGNGAFGKWVHYDANGQMLKGWKKVNGKQYYFDPMTGEMAHGKCRLNIADARVYQFDNGTGAYKGVAGGTNWDYFYENGKKEGISGRGKEVWDPITNKWYWLDSLYNGKKAVNKEVMIPYTYQGRDNIQKWVRYDANGGMVKGWYKASGKTWYYDKTTGGMVKGKRTIDGKVRYFDNTTGVLR